MSERATVSVAAEIEEARQQFEKTGGMTASAVSAFSGQLMGGRL